MRLTQLELQTRQVPAMLQLLLALQLTMATTTMAKGTATGTGSEAAPALRQRLQLLQAPPAPTDLRIESLGASTAAAGGRGTLALGLESPNPGPNASLGGLRLWWSLEDPVRRSLTQRAYETQLARGDRDPLYTSGRVETGQSEAVPLLGGGHGSGALAALEPDTAYAVRVRWWAGPEPAEPSAWRK